MSEPLSPCHYSFIVVPLRKEQVWVSRSSTGETEAAWAFLSSPSMWYKSISAWGHLGTCLVGSQDPTTFLSSFLPPLIYVCGSTCRKLVGVTREQEAPSTEAATKHHYGIASEEVIKRGVFPCKHIYSLQSLNSPHPLCWVCMPPTWEPQAKPVLMLWSCFRKKRRRPGWPACPPGDETFLGRSWRRRGEWRRLLASCLDCLRRYEAI